MVMGAFIGILFNLIFADIFGAWTPWLALLAAMIVSAIFSIMHAVASITFRADQVVSGVAINMLGIAIALFTVKLIFGKGQTDFIQRSIPRFNVPFLERYSVYWSSVFQRNLRFFYISHSVGRFSMVCHLQNAIWPPLAFSWRTSNGCGYDGD